MISCSTSSNNCLLQMTNLKNLGWTFQDGRTVTQLLLLPQFGPWVKRFEHFCKSKKDYSKFIDKKDRKGNANLNENMCDIIDKKAQNNTKRDSSHILGYLVWYRLCPVVSFSLSLSCVTWKEASKRKMAARNTGCFSSPGFPWDLFTVKLDGQIERGDTPSLCSTLIT